MAALNISLLGSFQVIRNAKPVTSFESDKVRALLTFLAVEADQPHRRETLAALLWPDMPEAAARSNLRHALTNLRKAIHDYDAHPPYLHITRQTLQFNRDSKHTLDVAEFSSATDNQTITPQLETAVSLYHGDFLSGFSGVGSVAFDEWAAVKREQYHQRMGKVLSRLAEVYTQRSQYNQAFVFVRRQVELEPWDETAHQQLMRLLALNGKRSAAVAQYKQCCRILQAELGIEPTAVTTTLYENIRNGTWPDDAARHPLPLYMVEETATSALLNAGVSTSPPPFFAARDQELDQLNQFLNQTRTGQNYIAFVTGEPGSGKTVLLHTFARQAMTAHPDLLVVGGKCSAYTGSGDPYLPFREIMQMLTGDVESRWAASDISTDHARRLWAALPEVTAALVDNARTEHGRSGRLLLDRFISGTDLLPRAQARTRHQSPEQIPWLAQLAEWVHDGETAVPVPPGDLFAHFAGLLKTMSRQHTLLLLLDDLQWIDKGSLNLLFHLGRHLRGSRILILGAYRPGDVAQGRDGQPHPLMELVNEFQQQFGPNQVDLNDAGGRPFIDALLDSEPNRLGETFRRELHRQTGGHALFTVELLRGLQERGDLIQDVGGYWVENGRLDWNISPARVEAAIAGRINRLPPNCRTALTIASVEGETFTAEVVAHIQQIREEEAVRCLSNDLSRQHRMVAAQSRQRLGQQHLSRYRFHHFLFQKYLYNDLDPVERAGLHEAVGETLEKLYETQEAALATMFGQLAWHYQEAGVLEKAITYCQKAGERAWQLSAANEAIAHLRQGLTLLEKLPDSLERKQQELALQMNLVMPLQAAKGFGTPEMQNVCDRAYLLSQQVEQIPQLIIILSALGSYYLTSGQYHTSLKLAQQKLELAQRFQDDLQIALARLGLTANYTQLGEFIQAREHVEKLLDFYDFRRHHTLAFDHSLDPGVNGLIWAAWLTWILGYPDQAKWYSREAIETAGILDQPIALAAALEVSGAIMDISMHEYTAASEKIKTSLQLAAEHKFYTFELEGAFYHGVLQIVAGETDEAITRVNKALDGWRATGMRIMYTVMLGFLAEALGRIGRIEEGLQTLDEAFTEAETRDERFFEAELYRIKGDLLQKCAGETPALSEVEVAVIESTYQQARTVARRQNAKSWELRAAISLAKLWQSQGKITEAHSLLSKTYAWFTEGFNTPDLQDAKILLEELLKNQHG